MPRRSEIDGRPAPTFSARVTVRFDEPPPASGYVVGGDDEAVASELARFVEIGVEHVLVAFGEVRADRVVAAMERFDGQVRPRLMGGRAAA